LQFGLYLIIDDECEAYQCEDGLEVAVEVEK
jgi:hypothetical protein